MNKDLQDLAWRVLPAEFRKEVKEIYDADDPLVFPEENELLDYIFGPRNLTFDAEGEEMLAVKAKTVREMYALNEDILFLDPTHKGAILLKKKLQDLFGSKCLPDEACNVASSDVASSEANVESIAHEIAVGDRVRVSKDAPKDFERFKGEEMNYEVVRINPSKTTIQHLLAEGLYGFTLSIPAKYLVKVNAKTKESKPEEPKFSKGNKVIFKLTGKVKVVERIEANGWYVITTPDGKSPLWVKESDIEPWVKNIGPIESTKGVSPNVYSSGMPMQLANGDLQVRLQVAAMAMQGILANSDEVYRAETCSKARQTPQAVAEFALACGDALIAKCGSEIAN